MSPLPTPAESMRMLRLEAVLDATEAFWRATGKPEREARYRDWLWAVTEFREKHLYPERLRFEAAVQRSKRAAA